MRLVSFLLPGPLGAQARIGALDALGMVVDLAAARQGALLDEGLTPGAAARVAEALIPADMVAFIEGGNISLAAAQTALAWASDNPGTAPRHALDTLALLPPVARPPLLRDFMAFESHLKNIYPRLGRAIPPEWYEFPVYYKGNARSLGAHGDEIPIPSYAEELDFEFELGIVLGRGGRNIPREQAMEHVFGYTVYNDFSARAIQSREMAVGLGPAKGKDFVRGHVFGPCLVTADEVGDVNSLRMVARVNGEVWCDSSTSTMHWKIPDLIAHASMEEELSPGEVWGSGTVGDGSGAERGVFLKGGDVVELEIERVGTLRNRVVSRTG